MNTPRDVIDDIRRSEFGIGESSAIPAIRNLRGKLHRALQQLAEEIYSEGIHFVLELVQNAEDNEYAGVTPELRFILTPGYLLVLNNETGFGEPSVRAICDVSRSTKVKAKGHIGEKGIGFKSVFRVTNEPHIFSNGYQFCLPKHDPDTGLGYVVPYWVEDVPPQVKPGETNIFIPVSPEAHGELAKVADINPSLLLFLKRLRHMEVVDEVRGRTTHISREGSDGRLQLRSASGVQYWKLVRQTIPVRAGLREEKRQEIIETELAVALPLTQPGDADGAHFHPVHAYLPIADYGLRFAFHADFVLAAGREGILTDRPWNQWLRDSLPGLFLAAVEECKQDERLRYSFLAYVPRPEDDVESFFVPTCNAIRESLQDAPCILTASGGWAAPSITLIADDAVRALISNDDALQLLGKELVAKEFRADTEMLSCLGAEEFTLADLIKCLLADDWLSERPDEWFSRLFAYLGTQELEDCLDRLKGLDIVPLEGGGRASTKSAVGGVFFPPSRKRKYGFESGLLVVRRSVLAPPEKGQAVAIIQFLKDLDIRQASPVDLIRDHMIPLFAGDDWRTTRDDAFRHGCVEYVKDHWKECQKSPALVSKLSSTLWLRIDGSDNRYSRPSWMYLSNAYENLRSLKILFRGIEDIRIVDSVYLKRAVERLQERKARAKHGRVTRGDRKRLRDDWRRFFVDLGVETSIRIVPQADSEKPNEAASPDLAKVIGTGEVDRLTLALKILDADWDRYARWTNTKWLQSNRGRAVDRGTVHTAFGSLLTDSTWIPAQGGGLAKPDAIFRDQPATRALLGDSVSYLAVPLESDTFIDALGIHRGPTVEAVLGRIRRLARSGTRDRALFEQLYSFLQEHYHEASTIINIAFRYEALIYIPTESPRFLRADQVFWKNCSALFGGARGYLETIYPHLRKLFCTQIEVADYPAAEDHGDRLRELAEADVADAACESVVWAIYRAFDRMLRETTDRDQITAADWWEELVEQAVFLTEDGTFASRDGVFANDNEDYAVSFRGRASIALFKAPPNHLAQVRHFLRAAGIPFLSQAIKQEAVVPVVAEPNEALTAQLRLLTPFLLRYLHYREPDLYDRLKAGGRLGKLEVMVVRMCAHPQASLTLKGVALEVPRAAIVAGDMLYVRPDSVDDADSLGIALASWLGNPKGLDDFLISLLEKREEEKARRFLVRKGIPELPAEEIEAADEAVRSAESGEGETETTTAPSVEAPAALVGGASRAREVTSATGASPSAPPSTMPAVSPTSREGPSREQGAPPAQPNTGQTQERTKTATDTPPQGTARTTAWHPPMPSPEASSGRSWRQCEPEQTQVSWAHYEPSESRAPRPAPPLGHPLLSGQLGPAESTDRPPEHSSASEADDPPDVRADVGQWGERYAVCCLRGELLSKHPGAVLEETARGFCLRRGDVVVAEVVWLNRYGEQGVGYDIEVIEGVSGQFAEVKSTRDAARACFDLSDAQWEMAKAQGSSYRIIRVYNAGCPGAHALHVQNPFRAWQRGELSVRSVRIVL